MMYLWKLRGNYPCVVRIFCSFFLRNYGNDRRKNQSVGYFKIGFNRIFIN